VGNIGYILEKYRTAAPCLELVNQLDSGRKVCQLTGMVGSQRSFVLAATATSIQPAGPHLVICETRDEAAYLHDDLLDILGSETVLYFPDSFKKLLQFDEINATQVLQRSEVISKLTDRAQQASVVVTYSDAMFEQVVMPEHLQKTQIKIQQGERLDVDFVINVLVEYGFTRADFVYEPGQFSIRGGIIDLFSYGNDRPYRIELFDDEVERIRAFDPLTQLSERNLSSVRIVPNLNTRFERNQKASLLYILPEHTVIWIKDVEDLTERLQTCFKKAKEAADALATQDSPEVREILHSWAFVRPEQIAEDLTTLRVVII
jgi:transcription-repair coupling factor (superfamily II helicase)